MTPYHKTPVENWHINAYTKEEKKIIEEECARTGKEKGWLKELGSKLNRQPANIRRYIRSKQLPYVSFDIKFLNCKICGIKLTKNHGQKKYCSINCKKNGMKGCRKDQWNNKAHPKGMKGKKHSKEFKEKMSEKLKQMWEDPKSKVNTEAHRQILSDRMSKNMVAKFNTSAKNYSRTHKGWMNFNNGKRYYLRSRWEMNYGCYLDFLVKNKEIKDWKYEEDTFWFEKIKRGVRSYTPDFKVFNNNNSIEYHEVKGWMDSKSKTKLSRMKKYYPDIVLYLIDEHVYKEIKRKSVFINGWE